MKYYNVQVMYTDGYSVNMQYPHTKSYQEELNRNVKEIKKDPSIAYIAVNLQDTESGEVQNSVFIQCEGYERFVDNI